MKKLLLLSAAGLVFSAFPALAQPDAGSGGAPAAHDGGKTNHEGDKKGKPGMPRLESADTNGDGFIEKSEFMAVSEKRFAEMDVNGDGKISPDEIEKRRTEWRQKMKEMRAERQKMKDEHKAKSETPAGDGKPAEVPAQ